MLRHAVRAAVFVVLVASSSAWVFAQKAQPSAGGSPAAVINLNTATVQQLDSLPGIGAKVAARIVEYRQKNGQFKKIEDLMNVKGIGEKNFLRIKDRLTVGPVKPAAANGQK